MHAEVCYLLRIVNVHGDKSQKGTTVSAGGLLWGEYAERMSSSLEEGQKTADGLTLKIQGMKIYNNIEIHALSDIADLYQRFPKVGS